MYPSYPDQRPPARSAGESHSRCAARRCLDHQKAERLQPVDWEGRHKLCGGNVLFPYQAGEKRKSYCIFDRDYHTPEELRERCKQAGERGIFLHIWERKEIENYLLNATVIARIMKQRTKVPPPTTATVQEFLNNVCEEERETVFDAIATHLGHQNKSLGTGGANKATRKVLDEQWPQHKLELVSGKALLTRFNTWAQEQYKTSLGAMAIAKAFHANEIPPELRDIITSIEKGAPFLST
jgi:hypothetical protein